MRKYIILYTGLLLSVSGCSLLELDESTGLNREEAYSYFSNVKGLATYVYSQLPGDLGVLDGQLAINKKEGGIEKSFGRQKMLGTVKPSGVIFFGTKGEDRNSFISIHRNKFAVQKQRVSDGAMKKHTRGGRKQGKGKNGNKKK